MDNNDPSLGVGDEEYETLNEFVLTNNMVEDFIFANECPQYEQQTIADNIGTITGNIPSRDDFPGLFNFTFNLTCDHTTSGQHWVFSEALNQLFIDMNKVLIMQFQVNPTLWTHNSLFYIRALPVYSTDDYVNVPVNRCTFHSCEDDPQRRAHQIPGHCLCEENNLVGHVVRAECDGEYLYDPKSERHSVRVIISSPQPGSECISIPYSFACKTSCPKGMQRRPIHVIFTLEDESATVLGRQKLAVKICSCPKRDKKRQEDDFWREKGGEKKKKRPITKDDLSDALCQTNKYVKVEAIQEPVMQKDDIKQQCKYEIIEIKRLIAEITQRLSRAESLVNRL